MVNIFSSFLWPEKTQLEEHVKEDLNTYKEGLKNAQEEFEENVKADTDEVIKSLKNDDFNNQTSKISNNLNKC